MTEEEKQEAFREEMRGYISADKKALENLAERVDRLEKTVIHGNGNPPLVAQIAAMQATMNTFGVEISEIKKSLIEIPQIRVDISGLRAEIQASKTSRGVWVAFGLTVLTVIGTAVVQFLLAKGA